MEFSDKGGVAGRHKGLADTVQEPVRHQQHPQPVREAAENDSHGEQEGAGKKYPLAPEEIGRHAGKRNHNAESQGEYRAHKTHGGVGDAFSQRRLDVRKYRCINLPRSLSQENRGRYNQQHYPLIVCLFHTSST